LIQLDPVSRENVANGVVSGSGCRLREPLEKMIEILSRTPMVLLGLNATWSATQFLGASVSAGHWHCDTGADPPRPSRDPLCRKSPHPSSHLRLSVSSYLLPKFDRGQRLRPLRCPKAVTCSAEWLESGRNLGCDPRLSRGLRRCSGSDRADWERPGFG
jgi:hypothetical protein